VSSVPIPAAPPVTNARMASALLALADAEAAGTRPATEYRSAAATLRQLPDELHGRRIHLGSLPHVSPRAADAIASFLSCGSDESVGDRLSALLDRDDPAGERKREFLSRADVDRILAAPEGVSLADVRGDIHLHTDRSDGKIPLSDLHRALAARGDRYALLTDHARDCAVAGGLHAGDFAAQRRELDRLNARTADEFAMLLGPRRTSPATARSTSPPRASGSSTRSSPPSTPSCARARTRRPASSARSKPPASPSSGTRRGASTTCGRA
jgi:hypothetical protein